jgi:hypothetical protein
MVSVLTLLVIAAPVRADDASERARKLAFKIGP